LDQPRELQKSSEILVIPWGEKLHTVGDLRTKAGNRGGLRKTHGGKTLAC